MDNPCFADAVPEVLLDQLDVDEDTNEQMLHVLLRCVMAVDYLLVVDETQQHDGVGLYIRVVFHIFYCILSSCISSSSSAKIKFFRYSEVNKVKSTSTLTIHSTNTKLFVTTIGML